jgi:hypothetical protein
VVVIHRETKIGMDTTNERKLIEQWVKKSQAPTRTSDPHEENKTYKQTRKEILRYN